VTLHYHGTPLTPRSALMGMAGKHFCVSFAAPGDADVCMQIGQSILWDNGAFSAFTRGKPLDVDAYYKWLERRLGHPHWAVIPDVIDGETDEQRDLISKWPYGPQLGAPVWHLALPIDWLIELVDHWPRICFGSSGRYWQVGSPDWCRRVDEAFNALARRGRLPWIHMLRGLAMGGDRWPFASLDSVNVARNYKDTNTDPERMARRIDAVQCGILWEPRPAQEPLFA
jgi:hypothetical protein